MYRLAEEATAPVSLAPRGDEVLRTSYEHERRSDVRSASRAVLVEFVETDEPR